MRLTPGNDIKNKDNESNNTTTGTCLPRLGLNADGGGFHSEEQRKLEKEGEGKVEHGCRFETRGSENALSDTM